ncbi:MAG: hypothetical protein ACJ8FU_07455 [Xanthobacteraceae bacterium]
MEAQPVEKDAERPAVAPSDRKCLLADKVVLDIKRRTSGYDRHAHGTVVRSTIRPAAKLIAGWAGVTLQSVGSA